MTEPTAAPTSTSAKTVLQATHACVLPDPKTYEGAPKMRGDPMLNGSSGCGNGDPTDWMVDAACHGMLTDLFFPEVVPTLDGRSTRVMSGRFVPPSVVVEACAGCSVRAECLAYAVANKEPTGVWGGVDMRRHWTDQGDRRWPRQATPKAREYRLTPARRGEVQVEAPCAGTSGRLS